ncbi:MAG TPA: hypothetical protein V6D19_07345 [Stenomitos sp.]
MTDSNADILELQAELEALRHDNDVLLGLMTGGYAYFIRQFMVGHQQPEGLTPQECERTILDALKRVLATQKRFECEYLPEIAAVLAKMSQTVPLDPYLQKVAELE